MQMMKVYDHTGKHVDSFKLYAKKATVFNGLTKRQMIEQINRKGYYVRSQFSNSGKTMKRSY